jgi:glycine/D-amino acid oxidase-like deaminating enzyme
MPPAPAAFAPPSGLVPMQARPDRIIAISVCTRPFRAQGPRIEAERRGRQTIVHNYGHGGSGWSLSWGAAAQALQLVRSTRERNVAVIGCGAIGLTTAVALQRAGLRVRIVTRESPPDVASMAATGVWSPASRICSASHATPAFQQVWQAMARQSYAAYQNLLGLPGEPVEWQDGYFIVTNDSDGAMQQPQPETGEPEYPDLGRLIPDLRPRSANLAPHQHPFSAARVRRFTQLTFNLPAYTRLLLNDFLLGGGTLEVRSFEHPRQFASLRERTIVNATGYGARALFGDHTLVPVRGQTARLIPQPDARYGVTWAGHNVAAVSRRDGILVQAQAEGDFGSADTTVDRAASVAAVERLARLFA